MLKPAHPSCPFRNPIEHLYFIGYADGEQIFFFTHSFAAEYAAHHWLTEILDTPATQKWINNNEIHLTHKDHKLVIKGSFLEDMIEYTPTKEEKAWTPNSPDNKSLRRAKKFWKQVPSYTPTTSSPPVERKTSKPKVAPRHRTQKAAPDGMITVAQIAAELSIQPNKARQILRKNKIKKPDNGWTYKKDDPQLAMIRDLLSKG